MTQRSIVFSLLLLCIVMLSGCSVFQKPSVETDNQMTHPMDIRDEKTFLNSMIPHHQEAVTSSQQVLAKTQDPELKAFLEDVITTQSQEIVQMKEWLQKWYKQEYTEPSHYELMMEDLSLKEGKDLEMSYIRGMIDHHQGAIEMAQIVLTLEPREEVKTMAENIITTQQQEIEQLEGWLETKYTDIPVGS